MLPPWWHAHLCVGLLGLLSSCVLALQQAPDSKGLAVRCQGTLGAWCGQLDRQLWLPTRAVPRGSRMCPSTEHGLCNNVGNCNHDTSECDCPAGWQGKACGQVLLRPCTIRFRDTGSEPVGHIDADGRDLNPLADGFTESRCIGICDPVIARCFCDGAYGRVNAPLDAPPGSPPTKRGRPLGNHLCQPSDDGKGNKLPWGQVPWQDLYGPEGWCQAAQPKFKCPCMYDGLAGPLCDEDVQMYCPNQCSGNGQCNLGFCKCNSGWYGTDCSRRMLDQDMLAGHYLLVGNRTQPWLRTTVVLPPAALVTQAVQQDDVLEEREKPRRGRGMGEQDFIRIRFIRNMQRGMTAGEAHPTLGAWAYNHLFNLQGPHAWGGVSLGHMTPPPGKLLPAASRQLLSSSGAAAASLAISSVGADGEASTAVSGPGGSARRELDEGDTAAHHAGLQVADPAERAHPAQHAAQPVEEAGQKQGGAGEQALLAAAHRRLTAQATAQPGQATAGFMKYATQAPPVDLLKERRRPFIYVYDLPPAYNTRMLQYRVERGQCVWRGFGHGNATETGLGGLYGIESLMHEMMLSSAHRTLDAEEADYFYVPIYAACFIFPIHCWADGPWWHGPSGPRVMHVTNMMLEARDWIQSRFPWWDRRQGRDHIWLMPHDEGACYAPTEIFQHSIMLTHWGRMDPKHQSQTAHTPDNYSQEYTHPQMQPSGWLNLIQGHPCYDPAKDLVIPSLKLPSTYEHSALLGAPQPVRDITLFFRGEVGTNRLAWYSRGIRQQLAKLAKEQQWKEKHGIWIGSSDDIPGDYSALLARARFCLVAPGDGWSSRAEDAVLHGCIPVVVMDQVHAVFESILDWPSFSVRVPEKGIAQIPDILAAISPEQEARMRAALRRVWHRFAYSAGHPLLRRDVDGRLHGSLSLQLAQPSGEGRRQLLSASGPAQAAHAHAQGSGSQHTASQLLPASAGSARGATADSADELWLDQLSAWGEDRSMDPRAASAQPTPCQASLPDSPGSTDAAGPTGPAPRLAVGCNRHETKEQQGMHARLQVGRALQQSGAGAAELDGLRGHASKREWLLAWRQAGFPHQDDALGTIMQWLYARLPYTR